jgi:hypothetical protein
MELVKEICECYVDSTGSVLNHVAVCFGSTFSIKKRNILLLPKWLSASQDRVYSMKLLTLLPKRAALGPVSSRLLAEELQDDQSKTEPFLG